jgi:hypothetical protein
MNAAQKEKLLSAVWPAAATLPLLFWAAAHLGDELWWDEIVSLRTYALVSFKETVTSFFDTNNHIFFNLLNNAYTRILGSRDFFWWLDKTYLLRLPQLLVACATLWYCHATARKFFGREAAVATAIVLTTTVPFLNFSLQLRGYGLSMLLAAMLVYHTWSCLEKRAALHLTLVPVTAFLLLYTIPSNVYIVLSFTLLMLVLWIKSFFVRSGGPLVNVLKNGYFILLALLGVALTAALLAYLPVINELLTNKWVSAKPLDRFFVLTRLFPLVLHYFISFRFVLVLLWLIGMSGALSKLVFRGRKGPAIPAAFFHALWLFCGPFVIAFVKNDNAFDRLFVPLIPLFAIIAGAGLGRFLRLLQPWRRAAHSAMALLFVYCCATLAFELRRSHSVLAEKFKADIKEQTIYRNYYLAGNFHPLRAMGVLARYQEQAAAPAILVYETDRLALQACLEKFHIDACFQEKYDEYAPGESKESSPEIITRVIYLDGKTGKCEMTPMSGTKSEENAIFGEFISLFMFLSYKTSFRNFYVVTAAPEKFESLARQYLPKRYALTRLDCGKSYATCYFLSDTAP